MSLKTLLGDAYREGMTAEEITEALAGIELPDLTQYVPKSTADKYSSEAASWKKKYREQLSDAEKREAEQKESAEAQSKRLQELERVVGVSEKSKELIGLGFAPELADKTAAALYDGDTASLFKHIGAFAAATKAAVTAELLKNTPPPSGGEEDGPVTKDAFRAMSLDAKQELARTDPELFRQLAEQK